MLGTSNHYLGFISIEKHTVSSGIVTDNVEGILEATLCVRLQVCVICTAFCTYRYRTNVEAKICLIQSVQARVNIGFKIPGCFYMTLSVSSVF